MSRKTNISRAGYECVTRGGYERVTRYNLTNDPCTRPTLYYKVANVLIQSPDFRLNISIMVVKCWRRHIYNGVDGKTYYMVKNEEWGDVDDPDA